MSDLPAGIRVISDEEAESFPQHQDPGPPDTAQQDRWRQQVIDEQEHEHPAFRTEVPD